MRCNSEQAAQFEQTDQHINKIINRIIAALFVTILLLGLSLYFQA
jgi:hypothetical protein